MNEQCDNTVSTDAAQNQNAQIYKTGKMTFIVTPVHREDAARTINDVILSLMVNDGDR